MKSYIEITKEGPPVIKWVDNDGWTRRTTVSQRALKEHGFRHRLILSVLLRLITCVKS